MSESEKSPARRVRWGIIGLGNIAHQFAKGLPLVAGAELTAVASRSRDKANAFGAQFGARRCYGSYEELARDDDVDAVYIATPHSLHCENSIMCIEAGKAVLCEKPFALNARQAGRMVAAAREYDVFLMEAMWTRFMPLMARVRELAKSELGEVRFVQADFGFRSEFDPASRIYSPCLGGGAVLDVGVYPISFASMLFGAPQRVASFARIGSTGVDEQNAMLIDYGNSRMALLSSAVDVQTPRVAYVTGTHGRICIHSPWFMSTRMTLTRADESAEEMHLPYEGNGYNYETAEMMDCMARDVKESPVLPLAETLEIMRTMDTLREQWDLRYPDE
jgi:predicted dehydrogenase